MNKNILEKMIYEEISKSDVSNIINSRLNSYVKDSELEKKVKVIVTDVMEKFFKMMFNKRGFWKGEMRNG